MIPIENLIKVGNQCYWLDPALYSYRKNTRKKALKRIFTIVAINGEADGVYTDEDDIILISDGTTESEVYANELVIL